MDRVGFMDKKGIILIVSIVIMLLLSSLGVFSVSLLSTDTHISLDTLSSAQAFFIAEAGVQEVLYKLKNESAYRSDPSTVIGDIGEGDFSVDVSKDDTTYTLTSTGTVGEINRDIIQSVVVSATAGVFNYAVYVGGHIHTQGAENLIIEGSQQEGGRDLPTVDLSYYQSIADLGQDISGNHIFTAGAYSGIWYIDGNVTVESNVTINGSIIASGNITMHNNSDIIITADSPYPALVSEGNFIFQNTDNIDVNGLIYVGADFDANFLSQGAMNINFTGTVIVAQNFNLQHTENVTITYDQSIADNLPPGFSGGDGVVTVILQKDWSEQTG